MGSVPGPVAVADRQIKALAGQVHAVVVGQDAQVDVRQGAVKRLQTGQQPGHSEGAHHADRQHLPQPAAGIAVQRRADPLEGLGQHRRQSLALGGEGEAAGQAAKQADPQLLLQPRHMVAERALAHTQLQRRPGEVQMPCRGFEGAQGVQRQLGPIHPQGMNGFDGYVQK